VGGSKVGSVSTIPLNFNLEIHPFPNSRIDPFIGPGFNRTYYTVQDGGLQNLQDFRPQWGALFNGGVDYWMTQSLFAEIRVRKLLISTDVVVKSTGTKVETLNLDPWTFGFSVGYRF
jgi:outer membrane protein